MAPVVTAKECSEHSVRLSGGGNRSEGRVEVCLEGLWSPVYANMWDTRDASVVCRQLGQNGCMLTVTLIIIASLRLVWYYRM